MVGGLTGVDRVDRVVGEELAGKRYDGWQGVDEQH